MTFSSIDRSTVSSSQGCFCYKAQHMSDRLLTVHANADVLPTWIRRQTRTRFTKAHQSPNKQRLSHPDFPPRRFWRNLSKLHLTKNALRALDGDGGVGPSNSTLRRIDERPAASREFPSQLLPDIIETYPSFRVTWWSRSQGFERDNMGLRELILGRRKRGSQTPIKSGETRNTTTTKSTGPYDGNFQQHLINRGVYPVRYTYPDGKALPRPDNVDEIKRALGQRRPSLSPSQFSEAAFEAFQDADTHAAKEAQVMARVIPIIKGKVEDPKCAAGQLPFRNLDHLTDGSLVPGNPDIYYGARPEQLRPAIYDELGGHIIPLAQDSLPVAPNFFLHVKGPGGSLAVASRQACYDGALGARGIHGLHSYKQSEPQYDNKAYTLTSIYHGGHLKMYTSHMIPPSTPGGRPNFAMTQIKTWSLTADADAFRQGAAAYRNGRDWAKRQRDDAIKQANERAAEAEAGASPFGGGLGLSFASKASAGETIATSQGTIVDPAANIAPSYESETSADEPSLDAREFRPVKRTKLHSP
ncbi:uncharacterized protein HRG_11354 [Hirsutella rhossiliensis]|uniref:Uncharacterized protein n=1 Tax=Hirsutella rhossiliensis TaxID=111463 RepID=A0A9P8MLK6_9HYPO|nr:uncharacterized protein HRG_11354 [Hirsutella rhossiliensis]KAH0957572.1 hypothetical protein HRG_11354 [Hirsutella rhossiliensis]